MIVDTGKRLTDVEKTDAAYVITGLRTTLEYLGKDQDFSTLSADQVKEYWEGVCDAFIESRVNEYMWRKEISQKYSLPYNFISRNGELCIIEQDEV